MKIDNKRYHIIQEEDNDKKGLKKELLNKINEAKYYMANSNNEALEAINKYDISINGLKNCLVEFRKHNFKLSHEDKIKITSVIYAIYNSYEDILNLINVYTKLLDKD